jgi:small subunit ribosomal protein S1
MEFSESIREDVANGNQPVTPQTEEMNPNSGASVAEADLDLDMDMELDPEQMSQLYEETLKDFEEGEVVKGTIIQIQNGEVLVDVGYKSEGTIALSEFGSTRDVQVKVGDEVEVYLEKKEDNDGLVVLSKEKANKIKIWEEISRAYEDGRAIEGRIIKKIKGGLTVDVGIPAFLPGSQVDLRPVKKLDSLVGQRVMLKVIKLNPKRGNIVLSRRILLEEEREVKKKETLKVLEEGKVMPGIVKNITEYGAFVDLGGMDGLLHVTDMSWGRIRHPSEMFMVGDKVEVVILKYDPESEKISLGFKQKTADPWGNVMEKYPIGSRARGKVVSMVDYGAFVELEEGVEGLIHVSEMSWTRKIRHPSKLLAIGDIVDIVVLDVNQEKKRISLGIKQLEPNPWEQIQQRYKVGDKVSGKVRNITDFGAFVELDEGIDGLVHISDLSWTQRIKHPSEVLKKGEVIEVVILNIDPENEKLSLGIKQLQSDPWEEIPNKYPVGTEIRRKISRLTDFGAFVELEEGIEGLIHASELDAKKRATPQELLSVGTEVDMKVIRIDPHARKIGLSIRAYQESQEQNDLQEYLDSQGREGFANVVLSSDVVKSAGPTLDTAVEEQSADDSLSADKAEAAEAEEPVAMETDAQEKPAADLSSETEADIDTASEADTEAKAETVIEDADTGDDSLDSDKDES